MNFSQLDSNQISIVTGGALPPKFLSVPSFQQCLGQTSVSTYTSWCMPNKKPDSCPDESWNQLQQINNEQKFIPCEKQNTISTVWNLLPDGVY